MLPHMTEPTSPVPVFDPRAVIEGRVPGRPRVGFIAGIVITAACAIVALGIDAAQSFAAGAGRRAVRDRAAAGPAPGAAAGRGGALDGPAGAGAARPADLRVRLGRRDRGAGRADHQHRRPGVRDAMPALGASTGEYVAATFGAPVVEETLKGLVLVGLLWRRRAELDGPTDGVIYAAMVGLGFAMIENVGYYINALVTPQRGGIELLGYTFVLRGVCLAAAAPDLHLDDRPRRRLRGVQPRGGERGRWRSACSPRWCCTAPGTGCRCSARGAGRRVPDHVLRARRADRGARRRPPPRRRPDPALPARLRAHRPGHPRRHRHARSLRARRRARTGPAPPAAWPRRAP